MPRFQIRRRRPPVEKPEETKTEQVRDEVQKSADEVLSAEIKQLKVENESREPP